MVGPFALFHVIDLFVLVRDWYCLMSFPPSCLFILVSVADRNTRRNLQAERLWAGGMLIGLVGMWVYRLRL